MKRTILVQVAALFVLFATASAVLAFGSRTFSGKITMIDPQKQVIVVKGNSREESFHAQKTTQIHVGGQTKMFNDLQKGEDVTITYSMSGQKHIAKSISAMSPTSK